MTHGLGRRDRGWPRRTRHRLAAGVRGRGSRVCHGGRERARIRSVIGGTDRLGLEGPRFDPGEVIFEDEQDEHEQ
jgi:hypothetical protein